MPTKEELEYAVQQARNELERVKARDVETIGYARRSLDHPDLNYVGQKPSTAFDLPLVYRADLENVDTIHKEQYAELQSKYLHALTELDEQCERIRELEQYISSHAFVSDEVDDYEIMEDDIMQDGLPSMEHNQSPD